MRRSRLAAILAVTLSGVAYAAQDSTAPPPSQRPILTLAGKGVQIYACQLVANLPQWIFQAPEASLFDASGAKVGVHGAGPSWRYFDGSSIKGEVVAKSASPEPTAIPWLLLRAVNEGDSGVLAKAEFIRRSDTQGGIAPVTGCDAKHVEAIARVPYTATYIFYSVKP